MKKIYFFSIILTIILLSCQNRQEKQGQTPNLESLDIKLEETTLSNNAGDIDLMKISRLTQSQYDSLQLNKVKELQGYDIADLTMGKILLDNDFGKMVTVQIITDGEITELLLSYDKNGNLVDNLIVAYEDLVEYYKEVTSSINSDKITVQTINFNYYDIGNNTIETADTTRTSYQITPELKFIID